jgi:hypothetical protein
VSYIQPRLAGVTIPTSNWLGVPEPYATFIPSDPREVVPRTELLTASEAVESERILKYDGERRSTLFVDDSE